MSVSLMPQVVPSPDFSRYSFALGPCSRHPVTSTACLDAVCDAGLAYRARDPAVAKNINTVVHRLSIAFITNLLEAAPRWRRPRLKFGCELFARRSTSKAGAEHSRFMSRIFGRPRLHACTETWGTVRTNQIC